MTVAPNTGESRISSSDVDPGFSYDPTSKTPYRPDQSTTTPPPITAPTPPPAGLMGNQDASHAALLPHGKGSVLAGISRIGNSLLKGYVQGHYQHQQKQADQANKMLDGLRFNYQNAKDRYLSMLQSGADPNSKEVQEAKAAADAAWASMMQMYGNYVGDQGKGKGKGKKGGDASGQGQGQGQGDNPIELMMSKDPKEKVRGWYLMMQKAGPDYAAQAQQMTSPEYQQQLKLKRGDIAAAGRTQESQARFDELEAKERTGTLTDPEKRELEIAKEQRYQSAGKIDKKVDTYVGSDNKRHEVWQRPDGTHYETLSEGDVRAPVGQGVGSLPDFIRRVAQESGIEEKNISAESIKALEEAWKHGGQTVRATTRQYVYQDKETGDIHVVPLTSTSGPVGGTSQGIPKIHAAGGPGTSAAGGAGGASGGGASATGGAGGASAAHATHAGQSAHPSATASPSAPPSSTSGIPGDRIIGHTLSTPKSKAQSAITNAYNKQKPLLALLGAQEDYMNEIAKDPNKASPRQDLSLVVAAVRAMNPGSVRLPQKELELEMKAGSLADQWGRFYEKAVSGLLPPDQRQDLFNIVKRETTKAGESLAADWQQSMSGQPLPEELKRYAKTGQSGSTSSSGSSSSSGKAAPEVEKKVDDLLNQAFPH